MTIILYRYPDCASHVVRMALEELGAPYWDETVDFHANEQNSAEIQKLNPRGLVLVLVHDVSGDC